MSGWRLWILLSPARGLLGREDRYGWKTIAELKTYADTRLHGLDLEARCEATGERWRRVRGQWQPVDPARPVQPAARPLSEEQRKRAFWMDKD